MDGKQQQKNKKGLIESLSHPLLSKQRPRNRSLLLQSGGHVEKDLRLVM